MKTAIVNHPTTGNPHLIAFTNSDLAVPFFGEDPIPDDQLDAAVAFGVVLGFGIPIDEFVRETWDVSLRQG
jgi:hypothetical protein